MKGNILIVDDDPIVRHLLSSVLTAAGHTVTSAPSGAHCISILSEQLKTSSPPNVIILDLQLDDMPGSEVLTRIRQISQPAHIAVVMCSANTEEEVRKTYPGLDMDCFLEKPFPMEKALAAVDALLTKLT